MGLHSIGQVGVDVDGLLRERAIHIDGNAVDVAHVESDGSRVTASSWES